MLLTGAFPDCDIKLCDFGIARHIARGADVREILGTPDYVGKPSFLLPFLSFHFQYHILSISSLCQPAIRCFKLMFSFPTDVYPFGFLKKVVESIRIGVFIEKHFNIRMTATRFESCAILKKNKKLPDPKLFINLKRISKRYLIVGNVFQNDAK